MATAMCARQLLLCLIALATWLAPLPALACVVCVDLPQRTLADRVLGDRVVVLARPARDNSFRFEIIDTISGDPQEVAKLPAIPFLVNSAARRKLLADTSLSVLMTFGPSETGSQILKSKPAWHRLMTLTPERRKLLDAIRAEGGDWLWGVTRDPERFAFFAEHHTHPDPVIQRAALSELERAPYALIRTVRTSFEADELVRRLTDKNEIPFAALYALLLGLSDHPAAEDYVLAAFQRALARTSRLRGAWIVAGLEVGGPDALEQVLTRFSRGGPWPAPGRLEVIKALSVTGTARPELRGTILPVLHEAVRRYPESLEDIAITLYGWRDWTLAPHFQRLLNENVSLNGPTRYILQMLVNASRSEAG